MAILQALRHRGERDRQTNGVQDRDDGEHQSDRHQERHAEPQDQLHLGDQRLGSPASPRGRSSRHSNNARSTALSR